MKLYAVSYEVTVVVVAEDEFDAENVADGNLHNVDIESTGFAREIKGEKDCPNSWLDSLPFRDDDGESLTARQFLNGEGAEPAPVKDVWTLPMFPEPVKP